MAAFALVFAALAALLHFYIFYLEVPAFGSATCSALRRNSCPMCRLLFKTWACITCAWRCVCVRASVRAVVRRQCLCTRAVARILVQRTGQHHRCRLLSVRHRTRQTPRRHHAGKPCRVGTHVSVVFLTQKAACTPVFEVQAAFLGFWQCGKFNESPPSSHRPQSPCR